MTLGVQDVFVAATVICVVAVPLTFILKERRSKQNVWVEQAK
ncbi:MAG: hypothetical protein K0R75_3357, partial [Paenibacillaceae bacterium]|nr:hypothetical protein [Paenibacillaceae bacterium]